MGSGAGSGGKQTSERGGAGINSLAGAAARPPQQALAPLQHGGRSSVALAPQVAGVRRELCRRLGIRYADLDAAGREALTLYARATAKLSAVDAWFRVNPVVNDDGTVPAALGAYISLLNSANRQLGRVVDVLRAMAKEDARYDDALQKLIAEGRDTRAGREADDAAD